MTRYCANCGTEVDESALFCPTCGQPIDQETETEIPPAPAWPEASEDDAPTRVERRPEAEPVVEAQPEPEPAWGPEARREPPPAVADERAVEDEEPYAPGVVPQTDPEARERLSERPVPPPPPATASGAGPRRPGAASGSGPAMNLPITTPVTLSAWLIGIGAAVAALGALIALFDGFGGAIDLLVLVLLLGVAVTVFFASNLPHIPQLRLATLAVVLIAFGIALDRLGFGTAGAGELLLFLGTAAAAIGVILVETGQDQPLGGSSL